MSFPNRDHVERGNESHNSTGANTGTRAGASNENTGRSGFTQHAANPHYLAQPNSQYPNPRQQAPVQPPHVLNNRNSGRPPHFTPNCDPRPPPLQRQPPPNFNDPPLQQRGYGPPGPARHEFPRDNPPPAQQMPIPMPGPPNVRPYSASAASPYGSYPAQPTSSVPRRSRASRRSQYSDGLDSSTEEEETSPWSSLPSSMSQFPPNPANPPAWSANSNYNGEEFYNVQRDMHQYNDNTAVAINGPYNRRSGARSGGTSNTDRGGFTQNPSNPQYQGQPNPQYWGPNADAELSVHIRHLTVAGNQPSAPPMHPSYSDPLPANEYLHGGGGPPWGPAPPPPRSRGIPIPRRNSSRRTAQYSDEETASSPEEEDSTLWSGSLPSSMSQFPRGPANPRARPTQTPMPMNRSPPTLSSSYRTGPPYRPRGHERRRGTEPGGRGSSSSSEGEDTDTPSASYPRTSRTPSHMPAQPTLPPARLHTRSSRHNDRSPHSSSDSDVARRTSRSSSHQVPSTAWPPQTPPRNQISSRQISSSQSAQPTPSRARRHPHRSSRRSHRSSHSSSESDGTTISSATRQTSRTSSARPPQTHARISSQPQISTNQYSPASTFPQPTQPPPTMNQYSPPARASSGSHGHRSHRRDDPSGSSRSGAGFEGETSSSRPIRRSTHH